MLLDRTDGGVDEAFVNDPFVALYGPHTAIGLTGVCNTGEYLRGYVSTAKKQGRSVYGSLLELAEGRPFDPSAPTFAPAG